MVDYLLKPVSAERLMSLQDNPISKNLTAYPLYWSPEIYNNPYQFAGRHYVWPTPDAAEWEIIVTGDERPDEPWNQRAVLACGAGDD